MRSMSSIVNCLRNHAGSQAMILCILLYKQHFLCDDPYMVLCLERTGWICLRSWWLCFLWCLFPSTKVRTLVLCMSGGCSPSTPLRNCNLWISSNISPSISDHRNPSPGEKDQVSLQRDGSVLEFHRKLSNNRSGAPHTVPVWDMWPILSLEGTPMYLPISISCWCDKVQMCPLVHLIYETWTSSKIWCWLP